MISLDKLPAALTVAVLACIFAGLRRHVPCLRLKQWLIAWCLIFFHFVAQAFEPPTGNISPLLLSIDIGALLAAAIIFLISVSSIAEHRTKSLLSFCLLALPSVAYGILASYNCPSRSAYIVCLLLSLGTCGAWLVWVGRDISLDILVLFVIGIVAIWTTKAAWKGSFDEGLIAILCIGFGFPGILLLRQNRRNSAGTVTIVAGFVSWGLVFPTAMIVNRFLPQLAVPAELWNVPKIFVAFGMILTVLEDKSESIEAMQQNEAKLNLLLARFSTITSQLLSGADVNLLAPEIATSITQLSGFHIAAIQLATASRHLHLAGAAGLSPENLVALQNKAKQWTTKDIEDFCSHARKVGENSFVLSEQEAARYSPLKSQRRYKQNQYWNNGDELLIPLRSVRGEYLGCIALDDPREPESVNPQELSRIELLAADLSVALEMKSLHYQLLRSEKLASLGQLVAGVAHELNNPLTAVMGYSELLGGNVSSDAARDRLEKLTREARRMSKIVDNLLRFSRQSSSESRQTDFSRVWEDVLALRQYYLLTRNIDITADIQDYLPKILIDEDQCKQVLLNLLNNAIDAVENQPGPKSIVVQAITREDRAIITIQDNGPGFADLNRAFDPFYTTKPVGKGTGLGLSICYGIIKEHGGEIRIANTQPTGTCVTVEIPTASDSSQVCSAKPVRN